MKRTLGTLVLALIASSCASTFTASAAVINGTKISDRVLNAQIDAQVAANPSANDLTTRAQIGRDMLTGLIRQELLAQLGDREGIEISDAELEGQLAELRGQFGSEEEFQERLSQAGLDEETLRERLRLQQVQFALAGQLAPAPTEEAIAARYAADSARFREITARHILYAIGPDQSEAVAKRKADDAIASLRSGVRSFESLAAESDDTGSAKNGGSLGGWIGLEALDEAFADAAWDAKIGTPTAPVRSSFGYHIILTTGKRTQRLVQVRAQIEEELRNESGEGALGEAIAEAAGRANILVNPRYGDWDPESQTVVPHVSYEPVGPAPEPSFPADLPSFGN